MKVRQMKMSENYANPARENEGKKLTRGEKKALKKAEKAAAKQAKKDAKAARKAAKKNGGRSYGYIRAWGYVGYSILWSIPVIGWIVWLVSCFSRNRNKRSYARSFLCGFVVGILLLALLVGTLYVWGSFGLSAEAVQIFEKVKHIIKYLKA